MRTIIRDIFISGGFEVIREANNGYGAVEKYQELLPDITIMDLVMPFKNGIEAIQEILYFNEKTLVLVYSGVGQEELVTETLQAGALDYIVKPPIAADVLAKVKKALS